MSPRQLFYHEIYGETWDPVMLDFIPEYESQIWRPKILIVEDDPFTTELFMRVLRKSVHQAKVDSVASSEEAEELMSHTAQATHEKPYNLVIADIFLEGKHTGIDLLEVCRTVSPEVPFIFTSVISKDNFLGLLRSDYCPPFLQKPFSPNQCQHLIQSVLS